MIATIRVINETHSMPGYFHGVKVADNWQQLKDNKWGNNAMEIRTNWYETHNERLVEVDSLEDVIA